MFDSLALVLIINKHTPGKRNIIADRLSRFQGDLSILSSYASAINLNHKHQILTIFENSYYSDTASFSRSFIKRYKGCSQKNLRSLHTTRFMYNFHSSLTHSIMQFYCYTFYTWLLSSSIYSSAPMFQSLVIFTRSSTYRILLQQFLLRKFYKSVTILHLVNTQNYLLLVTYWHTW